MSSNPDDAAQSWPEYVLKHRALSYSHHHPDQPQGRSSMVDPADVERGEIVICAWENFLGERANELGEILPRQAMSVACDGGALLPPVERRVTAIPDPHPHSHRGSRPRPPDDDHDDVAALERVSAVQPEELLGSLMRPLKGKAHNTKTVTRHRNVTRYLCDQSIRRKNEGGDRVDFDRLVACLDLEPTDFAMHQR